MTTDEENNVRYSINRGKPFGSDSWNDIMIVNYKLKSTIRNIVRQIKGT